MFGRQVLISILHIFSNKALDIIAGGSQRVFHWVSLRIKGIRTRSSWYLLVHERFYFMGSSMASYKSSKKTYQQTHRRQHWNHRKNRTPSSLIIKRARLRLAAVRICFTALRFVRKYFTAFISYLDFRIFQGYLSFEGNYCAAALYSLHW